MCKLVGIEFVEIESVEAAEMNQSAEPVRPPAVPRLSGMSDRNQPIQFFVDQHSIISAWVCR